MVVNTSGQPRSEIIQALRDAGVEANLGAQSLKRAGIYGGSEQGAPCGGNLYREGIALPMYERMLESEIDFVVKTLCGALEV